MYNCLMIFAMQISYAALTWVHYRTTALRTFSIIQWIRISNFGLLDTNGDPDRHQNLIPVVPWPCPTPPRNFIKIRSQLFQIRQTDRQTDRQTATEGEVKTSSPSSSAEVITSHWSGAWEFLSYYNGRIACLSICLSSPSGFPAARTQTLTPPPLLASTPRAPSVWPPPPSRPTPTNLISNSENRDRTQRHTMIKIHRAPGVARALQRANIMQNSGILLIFHTVPD